MGRYRKTRLNFGALGKDKQGDGAAPDAQTREIMEAQSERLYGETKIVLARHKPLTTYLVGKLLGAGEMTLSEVLSEIQSYGQEAQRG